MAGQGWFLVVDDDPLVARSLARVLVLHGPTATAGSCAEAISKLDSHLAGLVVDIGLPDGSGLAVLRSALALRPSLSALVLTGSDDSKHCHDAFGLGAAYLRKPGERGEIDAFGRRASVAAQGPADRVQDAVARWSERLGLTPRETAIVRAAVDGADHARLATLGNVTVGTIKNQVHGLLRKAGVDTLQELVRRILHSAVG